MSLYIVHASDTTELFSSCVSRCMNAAFHLSLRSANRIHWMCCATLLLSSGTHHLNVLILERTRNPVSLVPQLKRQMEGIGAGAEIYHLYDEFGFG